MIVVDASALLDLLLGRQPASDAIAERLAREAPAIACPHLVDAEVGQVLRRWVGFGDLAEADAVAALGDLRDLPLCRYEHGPLMQRAFALRHNASFYDALYLALAEALDAPLLTTDSALKSIPGHRAGVEVVD